MKLDIERCPLAQLPATSTGVDRWCDHCGQTVLNLSARTERQARQAIRDTGAPCVAVVRNAEGAPRFQPSRRTRIARRVLLLAGIAASVPAVADPLVSAGIRKYGESPIPLPDPNYADRIDFGGLGGDPSLSACHPRRRPHGPTGPAWVAVDAGAWLWRKAVLTCHKNGWKLRERRFTPDRGELLFLDLPTHAECSVELRGGAPARTLSVSTPARSVE